MPILFSEKKKNFEHNWRLWSKFLRPDALHAIGYVFSYVSIVFVLTLLFPDAFFIFVIVNFSV